MTLKKQPTQETFLARIAYDGGASIHEVTEDTERRMIVAVAPVWQSKATTVAELVQDLNALVDLIGDAGRFLDIDDAEVFTPEARKQYFEG
jgi:hypothetical protein